MTRIKISDLTVEQFVRFVSPSVESMVKSFNNMGEDSPAMDIMVQVLRFADENILGMTLERMIDRQDRTSHGLFISIFVLGMLCEREGWMLEDEIEIE